MIIMQRFNGWYKLPLKSIAIVVHDARTSYHYNLSTLEL